MSAYIPSGEVGITWSRMGEFRAFLRRRILLLSGDDPLTAVSKRAGWKQNTLSQMLNTSKCLDKVDDIAKALGIKVEELIGTTPSLRPVPGATDADFTRLLRWWPSLDTEDRTRVADLAAELIQCAAEQDQSVRASTTKGDRSVVRPPKEAQRRR